MLTSDAARAWEEAAREPGYRRVISPHGDTYDASGRDACGRLLEVIPANPYVTLLEYGCGDGRVTQHLVRYFKHVVCCDVSETMLRHLQERELENVSYVHTDGADLVENFDAAYSDFCLLHVPKDHVRKIVRRISSCLVAGGPFAFQLPCYEEPPHGDPDGPFGVGVWSVDELTDLATANDFVVERLAANPGSFSFETIGPFHQALHLFRRTPA